MPCQVNGGKHSRVSRYHGDKEPELGVQIHDISVSEDELSLPLLSAGEYDSYLLSCYR